MIGEKMFTSYVKNKDPQDSIIFGDGNQGKLVKQGNRWEALITPKM
jgi:hypothetical protein